MPIVPQAKAVHKHDIARTVVLTAVDCDDLVVALQAHYLNVGDVHSIYENEPREACGVGGKRFAED